jgi:hypothetical protein
MPSNAHDLSVAMFVRGLSNLRSSLTKGELHCSTSGMAEVDLVDARLAPGMHSLGVQVHWAAEGARLAVDRLLGVAAAPPAAAAEEKTFADLYRRIDATIAYLGAVDRAGLEAGLERTIVIEHRGGSMTFVGAQFLLQFAIPNFFFHATTAYGILRHEGVQVTKGDFVGAVG